MMAILKYPLDLDENQNDFIKFESYPYELNMEGGKFSRPNDSRSYYHPSTGGSKSIKLYMPNSTPASHYGHEAKYQTFPGPLGQMGKLVQKSIGSDFSAGAEAISGMVSSVANNAKDLAGGAAYQLGVEQVAGFFGSDAATALALGQGKIFNPNAEMIYKQPYHRKYNFTFDFVPKSREEATAVDDIIYEFKRWSAPNFAGEKQFMEIPHLWRITYHEGGTGKVYRRMNLFKPSMIMNFVVQDNPMSDFHITIKDEEKGHVPVHTAINIFFQETEPPTRQDHDTWRKTHPRGF